MFKKSFFVLFISLAVIPVQGQVKYTNQTVDMREGPGGFYDMILRLYMNNEVRVDSTQGYWEFVKYQTKTGWIPKYALGDKQLKDDAMQSDSLKRRMNLMFAQISGGDGADAGTNELSASPAQVAAAVKGFAKKYRESKDIAGNVDLDKFMIDPFTVNEYLRFRSGRAIDLRIIDRQRLLYPSAIFLPYADPAIDQIGYAVASVVAQEGLVENYEAQKYLDLMLALIVEFSHKPDLEAHAFILATDEVVGYSLPGNYIFISKGAIKEMRNESELAHFLGHELAHLIFSHGMVEYKARGTKIRADDAFAEMDEMFEEDERYDSIDQELSMWADEVYDYVHKDRLEAYEIEADKWAVVYTYLAGLDPYQSVNYLNRINISTEEGRMEWNGLTLEKRRELLNQATSNPRLKTGKIDTDQFQKIKSSL